MLTEQEKRDFKRIVFLLSLVCLLRDYEKLQIDYQKFFI